MVSSSCHNLFHVLFLGFSSFLSSFRQRKERKRRKKPQKITMERLLMEEETSPCEGKEDIKDSALSWIENYKWWLIWGWVLISWVYGWQKWSWRRDQDNRSINMNSEKKSGGCPDRLVPELHSAAAITIRLKPRVNIFLSSANNLWALSYGYCCDNFPFWTSINNPSVTVHR